MPPGIDYPPQQVRDLEATIRAVPCDVVVDASPVDLSRLVTADKPIVQVEYGSASAATACYGRWRPSRGCTSNAERWLPCPREGSACTRWRSAAPGR